MEKTHTMPAVLVSACLSVSSSTAMVIKYEETNSIVLNKEEGYSKSLWATMVKPKTADWGCYGVSLPSVTWALSSDEIFSLMQKGRCESNKPYPQRQVNVHVVVSQSSLLTLSLLPFPILQIWWKICSQYRSKNA